MASELSEHPTKLDEESIGRIIIDLSEIWENSFAPEDGARFENYEESSDNSTTTL